MTDQRRLRSWARDNDGAPGAAGRPVPALIPAATVIVVRDQPGGIETLMLRRNSKLEFAGGMWVFPGGRVDPSDVHDDDDDVTVSARRAAVREAKEEADVDLDESTLVAFSHWEPPPITPKRFSTWFFLAPCPRGTAADVCIDDGEIHEHAWFDPADALARRDRLEIELAPPTWVTLFELASCDSVADALELATGRTPEHFVTKVAITDAGVYAVWHGDAGYGAAPDDAATVAAEGARHRLLMTDDTWSYERT